LQHGHGVIPDEADVFSHQQDYIRQVQAVITLLRLFQQEILGVSGSFTYRPLLSKVFGIGQWSRVLVRVLHRLEILVLVSQLLVLVFDALVGVFHHMAELIITAIQEILDGDPNSGFLFLSHEVTDSWIGFLSWSFEIVFGQLNDHLVLLPQSSLAG
jgi:hypothetical protein